MLSEHILIASRPPEKSNASIFSGGHTQTSELNAGLGFFYLIRRIIYIMLFFFICEKT